MEGDFGFRVRGKFARSLAVVSKKVFSTITILFLSVSVCAAQDNTQMQTMTASGKTIEVPAGTDIGLVLVRTVDTQTTHRGDEIEAQITFPVTAGGQVVMPGGTYIKGSAGKLSIHGSSGKLQLQSASAIFPNGYVAPIAGPLTIQTAEWTAERTTSTGRGIAAITAPIVGTAAGALIGHAANSSQGMTLNGLTINPDKMRSTAIGAMVGGAIGAIATFALLRGSHQFIVYEGAPMSMVLQKTIAFDADRLADAAHDAPVTIHAVAAPALYPYTPASSSSGTCYTPETPGTPPTVVPGMPGPQTRRERPIS